MHNEKQDWSKAYQQIAEIILTEIEEVKHVDLYYGQERIVDSDGNWIPFRAPACFLQFDLVAQDLGELRQELTVDIKVYLAFETVQDTNQGSLGQARALQFSALMRKLHQVLHNKSGDDFGPLSRVAMAREEGPPYWYFYSQTFRTILLDYGATRNWQELGEMDPEPQLGLQVDPMPPNPPSAQGNNVRVRNSDISYDEVVPAPGIHLLPNVTHTDSDGNLVTLPGMVPMVCTPAGSGAPGTILTTDGNTPVDTVPSGGTTPLPQSIIHYEDHLGGVQGSDQLDTAFDGTNLYPDGLVPARPVLNSDFDPASDRVVTLYDLFYDTMPAAKDGRLTINDSVVRNIPSNSERDLRIVDLDGNLIGTWDPDAELWKIGNAKVQVNGTDVLTAIRAQSQVNNIEVVSSALNAIGALVSGRWRVSDSTITLLNRNNTPIDVFSAEAGTPSSRTVPIPLKFGWGAGNSDTLTWTVTDDEAGTYSTFTNDGGSGALTYSKNGAAFAALTGSITLAVGDTIVVRRAITTSNGWSKWA